MKDKIYILDFLHSLVLAGVDHTTIGYIVVIAHQNQFKEEIDFFKYIHSKTMLNAFKDNHIIKKFSKMTLDYLTRDL